MSSPRFKIHLLLLSSLLLLLSLASPSSAEKITLTLWEFSASEPLLQALLKEFVAAHPGVEVNVQQLSWEHGLEKIIVAIAAGNAPDVLELGTDWVPKFVAAGLLKDLTEETTDLKESYFLWESVTAENKIYGVPWLAGTRLFFYNKELFRKAGLNPERPPRTWEELLGAARKIHDPQKGFYGFSIFVGEPYSPWQEFLPFAWGNGATLLSGDQTHSLVRQAAMVESLSYYQKLASYSLLDRQSQVNALFANGKVGMQISGAWNFRLIPRLNPTLNFGVALLPGPSLDHGTGAAFAGGEIFAILKSSPHPQEAMALIRFLVDAKNTLEVVKVQQNVIPAFKKSAQDPYFQSTPQKLLLEQMATAVSPPFHPAWSDLQAILTQAVEEAVIERGSPEKILERSHKEIGRVLEKQKRPFKFFEQILTILIFGGVIFLLSFFLIRKRRFPSFSPSSFQEKMSTLLLLSPWLILFFLFGLYPLFFSFIISLSHYDLLTDEMTFLGVQNYLELFKDQAFRHALWNTLLFAAGTVPCTLLLALGTALLIHRRIPLKRLYQAGLFLPISASVIVIATLFTYLYSPQGAVNGILSRLGLPRPDPSWLIHPRWALPSLMGMHVWTYFGYAMILILAGLQAIPKSLYEAATLDGAGEWERFTQITLPELRPILLFVTVIQTITALQLFPEVLTMTQGGPLGATTTVVYYLYETGFRRFSIGAASAVGYFLFMVTMLLSMVQMRLFQTGERIGE